MRDFGLAAVSWQSMGLMRHRSKAMYQPIVNSSYCTNLKATQGLRSLCVGACLHVCQCTVLPINQKCQLEHVFSAPPNAVVVSHLAMFPNSALSNASRCFALNQLPLYNIKLYTHVARGARSHNIKAWEASQIWGEPGGVNVSWEGYM